MKLPFPPTTSAMRYIDPRYYKSLLTETEQEDFYKDFVAEEFILRDHLAIERTMLANEATFLAYIRTGLAMAAAGATLIHFATEIYGRIIGFVLLAGGLLTFFVGVRKYHIMKKTIHRIRQRHATNIK